MRNVLLVLILLLCAGLVMGAKKYLWNDASGSGDGTDWINAFTTSPASLSRGDTLYIAGGIYKPFYMCITDAPDGTIPIVIKKATASEHGTETGWQADFGTEQAKIYADSTDTYGRAVAIDGSGYVTIDGCYRNNNDWSDTSAYGMLFYGVDSVGSTKDFTIVRTDSYAENGNDSIKIKHCAFVMWGDHGDDQSYGQIGVRMYARNGYTMVGCSVDSCYFDNGSSNIITRETSQMRISANWFQQNFSHAAHAHGQQMSTGGDDTMHIVSNVFRNSEHLVLGAHSNPTYYTESRGFRIYNNIVYGTYNTGVNAIWGNADSDERGVFAFEVYHNTHIYTSPLSRGAAFPGMVNDTSTDSWEVYNNLFAFCTGGVDLENGEYSESDSGQPIHHDYNAWVECVATDDLEATWGDELNEYVDTEGNPFTDTVNFNWTLTSAIPGRDLSGIAWLLYDKNNVERGIDDVYDAGAFEQNATPTAQLAFGPMLLIDTAWTNAEGDSVGMRIYNSSPWTMRFYLWGAADTTGEESKLDSSDITAASYGYLKTTTRTNLKPTATTMKELME